MWYTAFFSPSQGSQNLICSVYLSLRKMRSKIHGCDPAPALSTALPLATVEGHFLLDRHLLRNLKKGQKSLSLSQYFLSKFYCCCKLWPEIESKNSLHPQYWMGKCLLTEVWIEFELDTPLKCFVVATGCTEEHRHPQDKKHQDFFFHSLRSSWIVCHDTTETLNSPWQSQWGELFSGPFIQDSLLFFLLTFEQAFFEWGLSL